MGKHNWTSIGRERKHVIPKQIWGDVFLPENQSYLAIPQFKVPCNVTDGYCPKFCNCPLEKTTAGRGRKRGFSKLMQGSLRLVAEMC